MTSAPQDTTEVHYNAVKRVINIFECPQCGAEPGYLCRAYHPSVGNTCAARIPIDFRPGHMVETAETQQLRKKILAR